MVDRRPSLAQQLGAALRDDTHLTETGVDGRRRLSRSRRSLSATVIAPVIVSPVSWRTSPVRRQVSSFLMLRLTRPPSG